MAQRQVFAGDGLLSGGQAFAVDSVGSSAANYFSLIVTYAAMLGATGEAFFLL